MHNGENKKHISGSNQINCGILAHKGHTSDDILRSYLIFVVLTFVLFFCNFFLLNILWRKIHQLSFKEISIKYH